MESFGVSSSLEHGIESYTTLLTPRKAGGLLNFSLASQSGLA
jgi:hypothetical protein